jgi:hypothetical protein
MRTSKSLSMFAATLLLASSVWALPETPRSPRVREGRKPMPRTPVATVAPVCSDELKEQVAAAAEERGISIDADGMLTVVREGVTFAAATISGFEQVPARDLPQGVDFGFVYLDAPGSNLETGYYTLRASAAEEDVQVGRFGGTVELVDERGKVAARLPATVDAHSLDVPDPLPYARTIVGGGVRLPDPSTDRIIWIFGWFHCPNGMWVCFDIIIFTHHSDF